MVQALHIDDNLLCPEAIDQPSTYFGRLRERDPVHWNPLWQGWIVTRHADVVAVLLDHHRFSSNRMAYLEAHASAEKRDALETYLAMLSRWLVFMDPPDHTRVRLLLQKASFTPRQLTSWRPRIQAIVDDLIAQIEPGTPVDFVQAFAFPLLMLVVAEILGFPPEDRHQVRHWTTEVALPFFLALGIDARENGRGQSGPPGSSGPMLGPSCGTGSSTLATTCSRPWSGPSPRVTSSARTRWWPPPSS